MLQSTKGKEMSEESSKILIKKYGNRRLYSTETSSYITLAELEEMVKSGKEIKVIDTKSQEDITAQVLTQILVEGGKAKSIPVDFLEKLIRQRSDMIGSFLSKQTETIEKGVDSALQMQQEILELSQKMMKMGAVWPNPFMGFPGFMNRTKNAESSDQDQKQDQEIDVLKKKIEELERKMKGK